jgi:hypothetical protein
VAVHVEQGAEGGAGGGVEKGYRDGGEGCKSRGMSHEKR